MSGSTGIATNPANTQQRTFLLTDIPDVMQFKKGWPAAAQLMRRWFAGPPYQMTQPIKENWENVSIPAHALDESIVKMSWLMRFGRVSSAALTLRATWDSAEGRKVLRRRIDRQQPAGQKSWRLGDLSKPASLLDKTCQVNILKVGTMFDPIDEFYGGIGVGLLKIAVSGMVTPLSTGRTRIEIDEVGIYMRDTYDFNDDVSKLLSQPLGYWGWSGVESTPQIRWDIEIEPKTGGEDAPRDRLYAVQNDDFQAYRKRSGRGGDFVIYSDVQRFKLGRPKVMEL